MNKLRLQFKAEVHWIGKMPESSTCWDSIFLVFSENLCTTLENEHVLKVLFKIKIFFTFQTSGIIIV
jgi:hypothetical protein